MTGRPEPLDLVAWAGDLLVSLGLPVNAENLTAVVAWARAEGGHLHNGAAWNPLNTTMARPGSSKINSHGVRSYPSRSVGLEATAATIRLGHYTRVVAALRSTAGAGAVANALGASPWGTSGALMSRIIPSARAQVTAHGPVGKGPTGPASLSAGGPLAGPRPPAPTSLPVVDYGPALGRILVNGGRLSADIVGAVTSAPLSVSTSEATQLVVNVEDPGLTLWRTGVIAKRALVDYGPLRLEVSALEVSAGTAGRGGIVITARPRSVQALKRVNGPQLAGNQSPTEWASSWAARAGAKFVGEPSPRVPLVGARGKTDDEEGETVWKAMGRYADELGFVCYEAAGVIFFGRPTWILTHLVGHVVVWADDRTDGLIIGHPVCRWSDDNDAGAELSLDVHPALAEQRFYAGSCIALGGIPGFVGYYAITGVEVDLAQAASMASITAVTPTNPTPNPPDPPDNEPDGSAKPGPGGSVPQAPGKWSHPLAGKGRNSQNFGQNRGTHMHAGTDIGAATGTPIYAAQAGRVNHVGAAGAYGNLVKITHAGGIETRYAHQSRFATRVGAEVRAGELIGYVGSTGRSTGPHLHFEVRVGGKAVNPRSYIG